MKTNTIEALNSSLDDNEEVYSNKSKEKFKDINKSHSVYFFYFVMSSGKPENRKVVFMRLGTSIFLKNDLSSCLR